MSVREREVGKGFTEWYFYSVFDLHCLLILFQLGREKENGEGEEEGRGGRGRGHSTTSLL